MRRRWRQVARAGGYGMVGIGDGRAGSTGPVTLWRIAASKVVSRSVGVPAYVRAAVASRAGRGGFRVRWGAGRVGLLVGLLALAVVTGCTSDDDPEARQTASPQVRAPSPTPDDPVAQVRQAVLAAYQDMWAAYDGAGRPPQADPDDPQLARYATGDALETLTTALGRLRDQGLVFAGSYTHLSPEVVELEPPEAPTTAKVEDCLDSSESSVVRADGGDHEDEPGGRRAVFADVELGEDGEWRITRFAVRQVGTC